MARTRAVRFHPYFALLTILGCAGTESTLITTRSDAGITARSDAGTDTSRGGSGGAPTGPTPGMSWQIQLSGQLDDSFDVDLYDIDLHTNSEADFAALHRAGRLVACYFSAGTLETWRGDADGLPDAAIGNPHAAYPSERWLDVRHASVKQLMLARIELADTKGCDAIQPANLGVHVASSGFSISAAENAAFAFQLADAAHARGLTVAWSDEPNLFPGVTQAFDWGIPIQCIEYGRCSAWLGFRDIGKALFMVEIGGAGDVDRVCPAAAALGLPAIIKDRGFTAFRVGCP